MLHDNLLRRRTNCMSYKILLIDDDEELLDSIKQILEIHNFDVIVTQTAENGLRLTQQMQFNLIITDYQLSGMTGVDFTEKMKTMPDTRHIPVLLLTGYRRSEIRNLPVDLEIMTKPFEIPALIATVEALIKSDTSKSSNMSSANS